MTETFVQESWVMPQLLPAVLLEVSSISRPEEKNKLVGKNVHNTGPKSRLFFCVAESKEQ